MQSDTVGNACALGAFYVYSNKRVHNKLALELEEAWPDKGMMMDQKALKELPYLVSQSYHLMIFIPFQTYLLVSFQTAVIKETLRMSHGVVNPMPRIVGPGPSKIAGHVIPAGVSFPLAYSLQSAHSDVLDCCLDRRDICA